MKNSLPCLMAIISIAASIHGMEPAQNPQAQLFLAAQNGESQRIPELHTAGAQINKTNDEGKTPLALAAEFGHAECMGTLLELCAEVNPNNNHRMPLSMAATQGHLECVRILIAHKADVNRGNGAGRTALMGAALMGHRECVQALIAGGAKSYRADVRGESAATLAATNGHQAICELLLNKLLYVTNKEQIKKTIILYLGCLKRLGYRSVCKNLQRMLGTTFIYCDNRQNFAQSIAAQHVADICNPRIKAALEAQYGASRDENAPQ